MVLVTGLLETEYNDRRILNFNSRGGSKSFTAPRGEYEFGQGIIRVRNAPLAADPGQIRMAETEDGPATPGYVRWLTLNFDAWSANYDENVRIVVHELRHCVNIPDHANAWGTRSNAGEVAVGDAGTKGCNYYLRVKDEPGVRLV